MRTKVLTAILLSFLLMIGPTGSSSQAPDLQQGVNLPICIYGVVGQPLNPEHVLIAVIYSPAPCSAEGLQRSRTSAIRWPANVPYAIYSVTDGQGRPYIREAR